MSFATNGPSVDCQTSEIISSHARQSAPSSVSEIGRRCLSFLSLISSLVRWALDQFGQEMEQLKHLVRTIRMYVIF